MKHSGIKQHIIETASSLFYQNGYNSTGINEIISESGIAKQTLYNHFKSKEDICVAYIKFINTTYLEKLGIYCKSQPKGKSQLFAILDFLHQYYIDVEFNGCYCINTVSEIPKENIKIRNVIQSEKHIFIQLILGLVNDNLENLKEHEIISLTRQIYLLYEGAICESHLHQADWPIIEATNLCSKILS